MRIGAFSVLFDGAIASCSNAWGSCNPSPYTGSCLDHLKYSIQTEGQTCSNALARIKSQCGACGDCVENDCGGSPSPTPSPAPGSVTNVEIINQTPDVEAGATIYDPVGGQSISVFGLGCPSSGCVINRGSSQLYGLPTGAIGIQWNINRLAPDGNTCDNTCAQFNIDPNACTATRLVGSGFCVGPSIIRWSPTIRSTITGSTCRLELVGADVENNARRCSCQWGQYPCSCPGNVCSGTCTPGGGACPAGGSGCACYGSLASNSSVAMV